MDKAFLSVNFSAQDEPTADQKQIERGDNFLRLRIPIANACLDVMRGGQLRTCRSGAFMF